MHRWTVTQQNRKWKREREIEDEKDHLTEESKEKEKQKTRERERVEKTPEMNGRICRERKLNKNFRKSPEWEKLKENLEKNCK